MSISALVFEVGFLDVRVHQFGKLFLSHVFFFFFSGEGFPVVFQQLLSFLLPVGGFQFLFNVFFAAVSV